MNRLILSTFASLLFISTHLYANEISCTYQDVANSNNKLVLPIYKTKVDYYFQRAQKSAYFIASWEFDQDATKDCFDYGERTYPNKNLIIPSVTASSVRNIRLKVLGDNDLQNLEFSSIPSDQWYGYTSPVYIHYSSRELIQEAINKSVRMIEVSGEPKLAMTKYNRGPVGKMNCADQILDGSLLNIVNRFKAIKNTADSLGRSSGVNTAEIQKDFMQNCLSRKAVNAKSFVEFDQLQQKNSKILNNKIDINGNEPENTEIDFNETPAEEAVIHDL